MFWVQINERKKKPSVIVLSVFVDINKIKKNMQIQNKVRKKAWMNS